MKYSLGKVKKETTRGMRSLFSYFTKKTVQTSTSDKALKIKLKRRRKRKQDEKNKTHKLALEEKRKKQKLALVEKLNKKQSQEAKAKKGKTRGMRSLFSFFAKKTVQPSTKQAKAAMTELTTAKYVEPSSVEHALASQTTSIKNLLGKATSMHTTRETRASPAKQTRPIKRQRIDDDVEIVQVQAAPKKIRRNKFFQFQEDRRPAFFGVGKLPSFASCRISARRPLEKDYQVFNYDTDSDEECDCVNGESLSGCDDELEDADPKENEFVHDGWLCGDNQVDWVQEGDEEESDFNSRGEDKADETLGERAEVNGKNKRIPAAGVNVVVADTGRTPDLQNPIIATPQNNTGSSLASWISDHLNFESEKPPVRFL